MPDFYLLTVWTLAAGFTVQVIVAVIGFVMMGRQLRTVKAVQAAIFLQMSSTSIASSPSF